MIRKEPKIVAEKPKRVLKLFENEFSDLQTIIESALMDLWLKKREGVWDRYLETGEK